MVRNSKYESILKKVGCEDVWGDGYVEGVRDVRVCGVKGVRDVRVCGVRG